MTKNLVSLVLFSTLFAAVVACARAQEASEELPQITERLWIKPGPVQDSPGAPKLLVIYPAKNTKLSYSEERTRYAGRVEPDDAQVIINGNPVKVYPGGVFTGLLDVPVGERQVKVTAKKRGNSTTVERSVTRSPEPIGPAEWPLAFHSSPVEPTGEYWMREGSLLKVKLYASPGHAASVRVGPNGKWQPMTAARATKSQGGAYEAEIKIDSSIPETLQAVEFSLRSSAASGRGEKTITKTSALKLRRMPATEVRMGVIEKNLGTYLMNPEGWDRFGNFVKGTPFPVIEKLGERVRVDFGRGETGYVEMEAIKIAPEPAEYPRPTLSAPKFEVNGKAKRADRLTIDWNLSHPISAVFAPESGNEPTRVTIRLIGADNAEAAQFSAPESSYFNSVRVIPALSHAAPRVEIDFRDRGLWGYGFSMPDANTLRLTVRARPDLPNPSSVQPLRGLRIMVDAGHGGDDIGAIGPSGLCEADVNLVTSLHLGAKLKALGATVKQIRTDDSTVDLDTRVDRALEWDPDLFISVHYNSVGFGTDPFADSGSKVFYHYPHSITLADAIEGALKAKLDSGAKPKVHAQVFRVNRNVSPCPSVLVEGAFVCNPHDEVKLRSTKHLSQVAAAIADGVVRLMSGAGE